MKRSTPLKSTMPLKRGKSGLKTRRRSSPIRRSAAGQECLVRIPGICNGDPSTVVLAHYRLAGTCGTGIKPDDEQAAYACSACHAVVDGRAYTMLHTYEQLRLMHCEGVLRTQDVRRVAGA